MQPDDYRTHHPLEVEACLTHRLIRKIFYCVGVNDIWAFDQHDKWRRFEISARMVMEPSSGEYFCGCVWWTNSNPRLTTSFCLDRIEELGGDEPGGSKSCIALFSHCELTAKNRNAGVSVKRPWNREQRHCERTDTSSPQDGPELRADAAAQVDGW